MIQTILMVIAVFLVVLGIMSFAAKAIAFKETPLYDPKGNMIRKRFNFEAEIIIVTIGLSYLIWYCN